MTKVCRVFWSRQPDDWDAKWEAEEQARRLQSQQAGAQRLSAEEAAWQQQVDAAHQQLLNQQKQRAALRSRIEQDARSAKAEQLRRIEPIAKARARAQGLASLGLDPEIMSLSEKFGQLSGLVDEVQRSMEAQYGLQDGALAAVPGQTWQQQLLPVEQHRQRQRQRLQQLLQEPRQDGAAAAATGAVGVAAVVGTGAVQQPPKAYGQGSATAGAAGPAAGMSAGAMPEPAALGQVYWQAGGVGVPPPQAWQQQEQQQPQHMQQLLPNSQPLQQQAPQQPWQPQPQQQLRQRPPQQQLRQPQLQQVQPQQQQQQQQQQQRRAGLPGNQTAQWQPAQHYQQPLQLLPGQPTWQQPQQQLQQ